jgi:peptidoglycan-associated lipoprotein
MNYPKLLNLLVVVLALSLGVVGCTPKKGPVTPIPAAQTKALGGNETFPREPAIGNPLPPDQPTTVKPGPDGGFPLEGRFDPDKMNQDRQRLAANTVYFEFDRATIKPSETSKIEDVAKYLQGNPTHAVQVEGHCDERGTEQYNLSLGERRALSVREYLVTAGVQPERVFTISYGEARPAETGHNEAAWSKNRRGFFVLLTPK